MTIHRIRLLGDPILRTACETISRTNSTAVRVILDDMRETLNDWQSRFGARVAPCLQRSPVSGVE